MTPWPPLHNSLETIKLHRYPFPQLNSLIPTLRKYHFQDGKLRNMARIQFFLSGMILFDLTARAIPIHQLTGDDDRNPMDGNALSPDHVRKGDVITHPRPKLFPNYEVHSKRSAQSEPIGTTSNNIFNRQEAGPLHNEREVSEPRKHINRPSRPKIEGRDC